tara:strand:+ start:7385 stop:8371 length:987 start_codon:yes stop_codon:yes gene_type:complete
MKNREESSPFSMSFLDIMACGFGALILILLISDFSVTDEPSELDDSFSKYQSLLEKIETKEFELSKINKRIQKEKNDFSSQSENSESLNKEIDEKNALLKKYVQTNESLKRKLNSLRAVGKNQKKEISEAGGITISSEYLALIIDTSGSMQGQTDRLPWRNVVEQISTLIKAFPDLKGIAVMKDTGEYLLGRRGEWLPDNNFYREKIIKAINDANYVSNSNPIPGLSEALNFLSDCKKDVQIFYVGDEIGGFDIDEAFQKIKIANTCLFGDRKYKASISALGFNTGTYNMYKGSNSYINPLLIENNKQYLAFMRELTERFDGTLVVVP